MLRSVLYPGVPLPGELLEILAHIRLELNNRLGSKDVRHELALPGMLGAVSGVEEASADRDKGVVEIAGPNVIISRWPN